MRRNFLFLLLLLSLFGGYYLYASSVSPAVYRSQGEKFEIQFPEEPKHESKKRPFRSQQELVTYDSYSLLGQDGTMYLLTCATYPVIFDVENAPANLQKFLQQLVGSSRDNILLNAKHITYQDNPGTDFLIQNKYFYAAGRVILAKSTMFVLFAANSNAGLCEKNFNAFANSLVIK